MMIPRQALLLSGDVKFMELTEKALHAVWPACVFSRVHPSGDLSALKFIQAKDLLLILDLRHRFKPELSKLLLKCKGPGVYTLSVSALSQVQERHFAETGGALLTHNLAWDSLRLGSAIAAACGQEGFGRLQESKVEKADGISGRLPIKSATDKAILTEELGQALQRAGVQRTRRGKISTVADELLMNALYHGPMGGPRVKFAADPETPLPDGAFIDVSWSLTREIFSLCVRDPFGTLKPELVYQRLKKATQSETVEITRTGGRGGGVGLFTVLRNSSAFHVYVIAGQLTEVSVSVDLLPGRERRGREILVLFTA
jgi:hypothetical protein